MSHNSLITTPNDLLLLEFQEAWSHYRHLETTRTQYLGFFFTVMLATLGFVIAALKDATGPNAVWMLLGFSALVWLLFLLNIFLFTGVKKLGIVLRHYEDVMKQVRNYFYADQPELEASLNVRNNSHFLMKGKVFGVQSTAEYILGGFCILLILIQMASFFLLTLDHMLAIWQISLVGLLLTSMIVLMTHVVFLLLRERNPVPDTHSHLAPVEK